MLCVVRDGAIFGDVELVQDLPTFSHSVVTTTYTEVFTLSTKNVERLVHRRNTETLDILEDIVAKKIMKRATYVQGAHVPLVNHLLFKMTDEQVPVERAPYSLPIIAKSLPDRLTLFQNIAEEYLHDKAQLLESCVPGGVYFKAVMRQRSELRARLRQQKTEAMKNRLEQQVRAQLPMRRNDVREDSDAEEEPVADEKPEANVTAREKKKPTKKQVKQASTKNDNKTSKTRWRHGRAERCCFPDGSRRQDQRSEAGTCQNGARTQLLRRAATAREAWRHSARSATGSAAASELPHCVSRVRRKGAQVEGGASRIDDVTCGRRTAAGVCGSGSSEDAVRRADGRRACAHGQSWKLASVESDARNAHLSSKSRAHLPPVALVTSTAYRRSARVRWRHSDTLQLRSFSRPTRAQQSIGVMTSLCRKSRLSVRRTASRQKQVSAAGTQTDENDVTKLQVDERIGLPQIEVSAKNLNGSICTYISNLRCVVFSLEREKIAEKDSKKEE